MGKTRGLATPLRYPGGKGRFTPFVKQVMDTNFLTGGHYAEPFAGGAGVALELLYQDYATHIHINDLDLAIYSFWKSAVENTDELCRKIYDVPVTIENWHVQKSILSDPDNHSLLDLALATFFLNRCNRSGILNAGVIGGLKQSGKWRLDERFNKKDLINRLETVGGYRDRIHVYNKDAVDFIGDVVPNFPEKSLMYLDPPYYVKGSGLYRNFYNHEDHVRIAATLKGVITPWIVSYDDTSQIRDIYAEYRKDFYSLSYTAQQKKTGAEVMVYGPGVSIPDDSFLRRYIREAYF